MNLPAWVVVMVTLLLTPVFIQAARSMQRDFFGGLDEYAALAAFISWPSALTLLLVKLL